ncbi:hypothetical protein NADE_008409 [Nannochloris sp. 'desiccata']|nr:hypothetical protein KSW81_000290 [Chlorella desiccata (nom. nud.)]KAH7620135.1 hypothetical protein NADE_008409 [Chlorella desiccata (nom. nud.)]
MRFLFASLLLAALLLGIPSCEATRRPLAVSKPTAASAGGRQVKLPSPPASPPPPPPHPALSEVCKKFNFTTYTRVTSNQELRVALRDAQPGDMIEVMPGSYWIRTPGGGSDGGNTLIPQVPEDEATIEIDLPDPEPEPMVSAQPVQGEPVEESPAPKPASRPAPKPKPAPAAKPKPAPSTKPKPKPAPVAKPKPAPATNPKPKPAPAAKPKPAPATNPKPKPAPAAKPKPAPATNPNPKPAPAAKPKPAPAQKPKPAPAPKPKPSPSPVPEPVPEPEPAPAPAPAPEVEPVTVTVPDPAPLVASSSSSPAPEEITIDDTDVEVDASPQVLNTRMAIKSGDEFTGQTTGGGGGGGGAPMLATGGTIFQKHGTPGNLITICGTPENTTFEGSGSLPNSWRGYSMRVVSSSYIRIAGFNLSNALKGIDIQNTTNSEFMFLNTNNTMQEGIRLRYNSTNNTVEYNNISFTGRLWAGWGEGIYVGTSKKNSIEFNLPRDQSDFNAFRYNRFGAGVLAENIDVKEFTTAGKIVDNRFNGSAIQNINGAMSWVSLKGNNWTVFNNTGTGLLKVGAGFRVLVQWEGQGYGNRLLENECYNLDDQSYCVYIHPDATENVVACTNTVRFWPGSNSSSINPPECNCVRDCSVMTYYNSGTAGSSATTTTTTPSSPAPVVVPSIPAGATNRVLGSKVEEPRFGGAGAEASRAPVVTSSWYVPGLDGDADDEKRPIWD